MYKTKANQIKYYPKIDFGDEMHLHLDHGSKK